MRRCWLNASRGGDQIGTDGVKARDVRLRLRLLTDEIAFEPSASLRFLERLTQLLALELEAFIIHSSDLVYNLKQMFELLWKVSK